MTEFSSIPHNVFILPTPVDTAVTPFWTTVLQKDNFLLQKTSTPGNPIFRNLMSTIANVFDTKQPPYRILFQREVNTVCLQIAVAETEQAIRSAWIWIEKNMIPELETIEHPVDKEYWVADKIDMIVTAIDSGTDELSTDENIRNASRTFRQIFDIPPSERFVNYYSCLHRARQGWLYISENYIGFHSFLLGLESKTLIELKDVQELKKERSKGIFDDSLRITTKDKEEYYFSNMFKRDEVYDLLIELTGKAMQRWLKSSRMNDPGASTDAEFLAAESKLAQDLSNSTVSSLGRSNQLTNPLKQDLAAQKRNQAYCIQFRLPENESLITSLDATYSKLASPERESIFLTQVPPGHVNMLGRVYLSQTFITFESQEKLPAPQQHLPLCKAVFPLYCVKRVEKIHSGAYTSGVAIVTLHKIEHTFTLHAEKNDCEQFCESLKSLLVKQVPTFKKVKPFIATCESEYLCQTDVQAPAGGLGLKFGYPEDTKKSKDKSKIRLWKLYFQENGRNLTMIKLPTFGKLIRVGLPNRLRGEIWEATSGAMYLRFANQGLYEEVLEKYQGQKSTSTEEIEKDLNRSLPEYAGYQSSEGIDRLRRVLTAYAWKNPELGYCQAMNIVTSALLIYTTEEQAFWLLHVLVDSMCPGYYSTSMYGALLDQIVFEKLVEKTMPVLWSHFKKAEVELSIACLPWFLSLYINSMPLEFAVRILDILFMEGPRILFQIGLAILKMYGEALLHARDDGAFLDIMKGFFQSIGVSNNQNSDKRRSLKTTKFNEVMLLAHKEFSLVTNEMIAELRRQNQLKVGAGIESFTKRTAIRHLKETAGFTKEDIGIIYDKYFGALYYASRETGDKPDLKMNKEAFQNMLASMTPWAKVKSKDESADSITAKDLCTKFVYRIYKKFSGGKDELIDFQKMVIGMSEMLQGDIMSHMDWFFKLYDEDKDGILTSKDILNISKEFYWLLSILKDDGIAWDAVTSLIVHSCEQSELAKGTQPDESNLKHRLADLTMTNDDASLHTRIKQIENAIIADVIDISLPSFRMVILTNESLEILFDHGFKNSFNFTKSSTVDRQKSLGRELFENLFVQGQKLAQPPSLSQSKSTLSIGQTRSRSHSNASSTGNDHEQIEVETLMDEWGHFEI
ncbi:hypothetical protein G6F46_005335 [Rhizopus delemar]|uniref:Rab-GAP TBC domain-containing protein n=2 Tax=Rhizopus TaxID=4842 RepID=A0A9P7CT15_9FUNG|nr:hypothetical protein G6F55_003977 [Rhizopus delemar]KAG1549175.1 hypothetical protein G6F51_003214 [Rhizopus arrhizus]KAG1502217.1 hypothetical protein G6F54_002510 [Rhizopus delemar]KAG1516009.1 hypothetical protein G6F53_002485 [Rhizopus delemar]KAG1519530.1 hypothetical protein G6F52_008533 [Rhizopus delemar]